LSLTSTIREGSTMDSEGRCGRITPLHVLHTVGLGSKTVSVCCGIGKN